MPNISGTKTYHEKVELFVSFPELLRAMEMEIKSRFKIASDAYLNDENQIVCEERNWRHGSVGTDMLDKKPSASKIKALKLIAELHDLNRQFMQEDNEL